MENFLGHIRDHNNFKDLDKFLNDGFDIYSCDEYGKTILHYAAELGEYDVVMQLIERGMQLNIYDNLGRTPLHLAVSKKRIDTAILLIDKGVEVETVDINGFTPLLTAIQMGCSPELVTKLCNAGANVNFQGSDKNYPIHKAVEISDIELIRILLKFGANINAEGDFHEKPIYCAYKNENLDIALLLLELRAVVEIDVKDGLLLMAASQDRIDVIRWLLNDSDAIKLDFIAALCKAATYGYQEICKLLIDQGIDLNRHTSRKLTALHFASANGHIELVKLFIENGANINALAYDNLTALHFAAKYGYLLVVQFLIEKGADCAIKDVKGLKAKDYALNEEIKKLLELKDPIIKLNLFSYIKKFLRMLLGS